MVLPAPDLDDRTFQNLVDDAKRLVQERCPTWTDHNVSDPGVTLIEAFAHMVDQLIYRLNRVPERNYVKFLELVGVELLPPAAARGTCTFWLSARQPQKVLVRAETEVATARTDISAPVMFTTVSDLEIVPCSFSRAVAIHHQGQLIDLTSSLDAGAGGGAGAECFSPRPVPGDAFLIGLSNAVPSCVVVIRIDCPVQGIGVDPSNPPLVWEARTATGDGTDKGDWVRCEVERDGTGGLNRPGDVVLHIPSSHDESIIGKKLAGWLRCRVVEPEAGQPTYTETPRVLQLSAFTIGGTVATVHAEVVRNEELGRSSGTPGQRFQLERRPVVPSEEPTRLQVSTGDAWVDWERVEHFAASGPDDTHFRIDAVSGEVQLGPAVREADGSLRNYAAVPPKGALLRIAAYRTGGGQRGNVSRGQVRLLKTSVPYVSRVENRVPAVGGVDGESIENAKLRGPIMLRSRGRAVTAEDFEQLAREVAPEAARVRCIAATDPRETGGVRVLVVPHVASDDLGGVSRDDLVPPDAMLTRITAHLEERRLVGTRLLLVAPEYRGLTAVVSVKARRGHDPVQVRLSLLRALYRLFHPIYGGPAGTGWPFGRPVQAHEVHAALAAVPGVDMSEEITLLLFPADEKGVRTKEPVQRMEVPPHGLVFSYQHQVQVRDR